MKKTILLCLIVLSSTQAGTNLIINGDFQNHPPLSGANYCPTCVYPYQSGFTTNFIDYSWYDGNFVELQFRSKRFSNISSTIVIDSCAISQTKLMQDIKLTENSFYRFAFDMCKNQWQICSYLSCWIGTQQMYYMEKNCMDGCFPYQKFFRWYKNEALSVMFKGYNNNYLTQICTYGPLLDNVTLVQLQQINRTLSIVLKPLKSITPCIQITTNLILMEQLPDKLSKLAEQFHQIQNNGIIYNDFQFTASNQGQFRVLLYLKEDLQINNLTIVINSFIINDTLYNFFSGDVTIQQPLTLLFNEKYKIANFLNDINKPFSHRLRESVLLSRALGIGSIFLDIFAFWQIAIFYHYVGIETPSYVKYSVQESFKNFLLFGIYKEVQLDSYVYPSSNFSMHEKIPSSDSQWYWFYELGYTSNYYKNNLESYTMIGFGLIRSIVFQIIFFIIGFKIFRMNRKWHLNFFQDVVSWIPFLVLVPAIMINTSFLNISQKINYILHILTMFFCLVTPPLFLILNFMNINSKQNSKEPKIMKTRKKVEIIYVSLEFTFIFTLTFLTGMKQKNLFLLVSLCLIFGKLFCLRKFRIYFNKFDFILKLLGQIIWLFYTINFILFRIVEELNNREIIDIQKNGFWKQCFEYLGITVLIIFSIGGWSYLLMTCINFLHQFKEVFCSIKKDCIRKLIKNKISDIEPPKTKKIAKIKNYQLSQLSVQNEIITKNSKDTQPHQEAQVHQIQIIPKQRIRMFAMKEQMKRLKEQKSGNLVRRQQMRIFPRIVLKENRWIDTENITLPQ